MTAPTPQELGRLFAEVFDLCDQVAASITDDEVEEKLNELLSAHLEEALAEPLPPCEVRVSYGWLPPSVVRTMPTPPSCGAPAVSVVTYTCTESCREPWRRSTCQPHLDEMRATPTEHARCGYCGGYVRIGGLS